MPPTTTATLSDSESIDDLRRRVEVLEAHVAALGQPVAGAVKRGWRAQIGAFGDDPVYGEIVRLGREWREAQVPGAEQGEEE